MTRSGRPTPVRRALVPLLLLVSAALGPIVVAHPAAACTCGSTTDEKAFAASDAVFTGEVVASTTRWTAGTLGREDGAVIRTVAVTRAFKGDVTRTLLVATSAGSTCTTGFEAGGAVLVFAHVLHRPARLPYDHASHTTDLCGGSRPLDARPVPASFGPGVEPTALESVTPLPVEPDPPPAALPATDPRGSSASGGLSWWVTAATAVAAAAVGAAAGPGLRRRKTPAP